MKGDGRWPDGTGHDVSVTFVNDLYHGTASTDRNLYFKGAELNGAKTDTANPDEWLNSTGSSASIRIDDAPATPTTSTDSLDKITVKAQGDAYWGYPNFALKVDGKLIDGDNTVLAERSDGEWQTFEFVGEFDAPGAQTHQVEILFDNDFGAGFMDRNLYIDEVTFNGVSNGTDATFTTNSSKVWDFSL